MLPKLCEFRAKVIVTASPRIGKGRSPSRSTAGAGKRISVDNVMLSSSAGFACPLVSYSLECSSALAFFA